MAGYIILKGVSQLSEKFEIRKTGAIIDVVHTYFGEKLEKPIKKIALTAVFKNPYGKNVIIDDLEEITKFGGGVGEMLGKWGAELLGGAENVQAMGKAAICGEDVEIELGQAAVHADFGYGVRRALNLPCKAIIVSTHAVGPVGHSITVPLYHREALKVRDNFDAIEVRMEGAPKADEIMLIIAMADGGRPKPRINGPTTPTNKTYKGEDGLV